MAVKIRLQRRGKKNRAFYHIVVADGRAPRDGRFIERIGSYDPVTEPATIELDVDRACYWLKNGAQPTDTARSILSHKGVMLKRHLQIGVEKGAITQEVADQRLEAWLMEKGNKISREKEEIRNRDRDEAKKALAAEMEANAKKAEEIAKKRAEEEAALRAEEEAKRAEEEAANAAEEEAEENATPEESTPEEASSEQADE